MALCRSIRSRAPLVFQQAIFDVRFVNRRARSASMAASAAGSFGEGRPVGPSTLARRRGEGMRFCRSKSLHPPVPANRRCYAGPLAEKPRHPSAKLIVGFRPQKRSFSLHVRMPESRRFSPADVLGWGLSSNVGRLEAAQPMKAIYSGSGSKKRYRAAIRPSRTLMKSVPA